MECTEIEKYILYKIYRIQFQKESGAIDIPHQIRRHLVAEHIRPQLSQHSLVSQQLNKGPYYINNKEMRTLAIRKQNRRGISNKDNLQAEMTGTKIDQAALIAADLEVLC